MSIKIVEAPWCRDLKEYLAGVDCRDQSKDIPENATEDFICGYADQYALEQCNDHRSLCHAC